MTFLIYITSTGHINITQVNSKKFCLQLYIQLINSVRILLHGIKKSQPVNQLWKVFPISKAIDDFSGATV